MEIAFEYGSFLLPAATGLFIAVALFSGLREVFGKGLRLSRRIAVIGEPRAGKTTLITAIFDQIMSGHSAKNITVSGRKTVDRITDHLMRVRRGGHLEATRDSDVFAYRFQHKRMISGVIPVRYDVEIADFPGEYSQQLSLNLADQESKDDLLVSKEFFSWVLQAQRYIFVIDIEKYMGRGQAYCSEIDSMIKNVVLNLKQELLDESVYDRSVIVVFTKMDLLLDQIDEKDAGMKDYVFGDSAFESLNAETRDSIENKAHSIIHEFSRTISFMNANFRDVRVTPVSSYSMDTLSSHHGERVTEFCLP